MISLRCEDCMGTMEVDESREILTCPYCGSKKIIPVSDAVKIEQIRQQTELEQKKMDFELKKRKDVVAVVLVVALVFIVFIAVLMGFITGH